MKKTCASFVVSVCLQYIFPVVANGDVLSALESGTFDLHLGEGAIRVVDSNEIKPIDYDSSWSQSDEEGVEVSVSVNGEELYRGQGYGQIDWKPSSAGVYRLVCAFSKDGLSVAPSMEREIEKIARVYSITYTNLKGAQHANPATYQEETAFAFAVPTTGVTGYTFDKWTPAGIAADMTGDQVVTAGWTANSYSVVFHANGGSGTMDNLAMTYDVEAAVTSNAFVRSGYAFKGWATEADGAVVYADGVTVSNLTAQAGGAVELYAVWQLTGVPDPVITPADGSTFTEGSQTVTIACPLDGAAVYFTTNGANPKATEKYLYSAPIVITDTTTVKAFAALGEVKSSLVSATITKKVLTLAGAVDSDLTFTTGGDAQWKPVSDSEAKTGGECAKSGAVGDDGESWIETTVSGAGAFSFWWKTDCELDEWGDATFDHLAVYTNGVEAARLDGTTGWEQITYAFGKGTHTVRWAYEKDDGDMAGEDCGWIDGVTWEPAAAPADPIPDLGDNPTEEEIAEALENSVDEKLASNITDGETYNDFRDWAETIGPQTVKDSSNAWVSFALGQNTLLVETPTDEDLSIEAFEPAVNAGKFDFTVSVKDIEVGAEAAAENLKKVFGLEGGSSLQGLSSDNVDITFNPPENGKVKFTAGPNAANADATTFFMKVKLAP